MSLHFSNHKHPTLYSRCSYKVGVNPPKKYIRFSMCNITNQDSIFRPFFPRWTFFYPSHFATIVAGNRSHGLRINRLLPFVKPLFIRHFKADRWSSLKFVFNFPLNQFHDLAYTLSVSKLSLFSFSSLLFKFCTFGISCCRTQHSIINVQFQTQKSP